MSIVYLCTVGLSSICRGLLLCNLCNSVLERKYQVGTTYLITIGFSFLFGYFPLMGYLLSPGLLLINTVLYYVGLFAMPVVLYKNRFIAKFGYFCLIILGITFGQIGALLVFLFLPKQIAEIVNDPTLVGSVFSLDFILLCGTVIITFLVTYFVCRMFLYLYRRISHQAEFTSDTRFILVIASQFVLLFFFLLMMFYEQQLYGSHDPSIWVALVIAVTVCVVADIFLFRAVRKIDQKYELEAKLKLMEQSQLSYYEQYRTVDSLYRQERIFHHDINNKLTAVVNLLTCGKSEQASQLLQELGADIASYRRIEYCENALINTVLNSKLKYAKTVGIATEVSAAAGELPIPQTDLCSLFSNILDNAIEACCRLPQEAEKQISLQVYLKNGYLAVHCKNTAPPLEEKAPADTNFARLHGWGLKILKQIAEKYDGHLATEYEENCFSLQVVLKICD